jgi:glycerophosphoryl diester phosphodiesterase
MTKRYLCLLAFILSSCVLELPTAPELNVNLSDFEVDKIPLSELSKSEMNGVYSVIQGKEILGDEIVGVWVGNRWCFHSKNDVIYSENSGGITGSEIKFTGYIRLVRSGSGYIVDLSIKNNDGAVELISGESPSQIVLAGETRDGVKINLKRKRSLYNTQKDFAILGHRGGGRNSERLGYSENSIEMIIHSQILGATGVEIDVKRTRDGQLIVFHDDTFSPRTVKGSYLLGKVENFDLEQIKTFGHLINGEDIPTLSEALNAVIDKTSLSMVWLDIKDPATVDEALRIQSEAITYANLKSRDVKILFGIPSDEVLRAYQNSKLINATPVLIELNADIALSYNNCEVWAPRWTNGIPSGDISRFHSMGKKVFVWTLDVRDYINDFLNNNGIDGILSNYPSLVSGMYYSKE